MRDILLIFVFEGGTEILGFDHTLEQVYTSREHLQLANFSLRNN